MTRSGRGGCQYRHCRDRQVHGELGGQFNPSDPANSVSTEYSAHIGSSGYASRRLALGVLRSLTGLLEAVLLPLGRPGVPRKETGLLQRWAILRIDQRQRAGHTEPQRSSLTRNATAADARDHVELALGAERHEGLADDLLVNLVREVGLKRAAVDLPLARARHDPHAGDGLLAAAQAAGVPGDHRTACRALRATLRRLGGVLRRSGFLAAVELVLGGVLRVEVCRLVCGRLDASGLGHVALPHASLRRYWEICRISY